MLIKCSLLSFLDIKEVDDHVQLHWQNQNMPKCHEQNAFGNIIHESRSCFPLRPNYDVFDLHRKTLKSYLDVTNRKKAATKRSLLSLIGMGDSCSMLIMNKLILKLNIRKYTKENTHECTEYGKAFLKKSLSSMNIK